MSRVGVAVIGGALALLVLVFAPSASATKYYDSNFGSSPGATGGLFATGNGGIGDIAVNDPAVTTDGTAQSGWIYVVDRGNNRVQVFDANKAFQFAIGRDVVAAAGTGDTSERQTVTIGGAPAGGTFTLTFGANTTAPIAFNATAGDVDTALEALASVGANNVNVTGSAGGPYTVDFVGARASVDQAQMTANGSGLTPAGTAAVATGQDGASFEKCTVAAQCKLGTTATTAATSLGNAGTLNIAQGIDIDQTTGHIFVNERATSTSGAGAGNRRVQEFTATGAFVRAFGWDVTAPAGSNSFETCNAASGDICQPAQAAGTANGQMGNSTQAINGLAVAPPTAPNAGTVYVADPANRRVLPFSVPASPTGSVSPGTPFGSITQFPQANWPRDIAADANGVVYASLVAGTGAASGVDAQVARFDTGEGGFKTAISPLDDDDFFGRGTMTSLEIDDATGHLFAGRAPSTSGTGLITTGIVELDVSSNPAEVDVSHLVDIHAVGLGLVSTSSPLALGIGAGRLLLSVSAAATGTGSGHRVVVLDDTGVDPPPSVTLAPPSNIGCASATLNAQINPNGPTGFPTSYRFELSKDGVDWSAVASDSSLGDGGTPVQIADEVADLEANTFYRVRVITTRSPSAGRVTSPELTFLTDPCPPIVETIAAQQVSDGTAQLVGRINPNGLQTSYWFEWGDDDYGNVVPVPAATAGSGSIAKVVGEALSGLDSESVYHFRLCGQNSLAPSAVCGADRTFTTRSPVPQAESRAYEMVTSPDKVLRRGGNNGDAVTNVDYVRFEAGLPAIDGNSLLWSVYAGVSDPDAGNGWSGDRVYEVRQREDRTGDGKADRWYGEAAIKIPPPTQSNAAINDFIAVSPDLSTQAWNIRYSLFSSGAEPSTHVMGDDGGPRGAGWYPWLDPLWYEGPTIQEAEGYDAIIDDDGDRLVAWDGTPTGSDSRNVRPSDDTLTPAQLDPPQTGGRALFMTNPAGGWRPDDLINECSGAGAGSTTIPRRDDAGTLAGPATTYQVFGSYGSGSTTVTLDSATVIGSAPQVGQTASGPGIQPGTTVVSTAAGAPAVGWTFTISSPTTAAAGPFAAVSGGQNTANLADDTIAEQPCEQGSPTSIYGASLGSVGATSSGEVDSLGDFIYLKGPGITALSDDGKRVFFLSPDPKGPAAPNVPTSCAAGDGATGTGTNCPPQLFVRQYDDEGEPTVRWISRAEDALFNAPQRVAAFGNGVSFEGASRDGRVVYFRTNAPLTQDDPNGGNNPVTGTASSNSWDLYRYELPTDNNVDPGGGTLTRVSKGPGGLATGTGDTTNGSPTVTGVNAASGSFSVGQIIRGAGIPPGTSITAVSVGQVTLSQNATATAVAVALNAAADPNVSCALVAATGADTGNCSGAPDSSVMNGAGTAVRFMSDDGQRVYFSTAAEIPGAVNAPPTGGATTPTSAASQINGETRNLYLYDADKSGAASYEFIARVPFDRPTSTSILEKCASSESSGGSVARVTPQIPPAELKDAGSAGSCVHGTRSGDTIVFETPGRLTTDDTGTAVDVYLYDAVEDELIRLSAPPAGSAPYPCFGRATAPTAYCNGDLGMGSQSASQAGQPKGTNVGQAGLRHYNIAENPDGTLRAVYFETRLPLAEGDVNGDRMDVYEWRAGKLSLISSGTGDASAFYTGNSRDGRDVFFWTEQRISPWEIDATDGDVYDARVGGGLPDPPVPPSICDVLGSLCQGAGAAQVAADPKTASSASEGNAEAGDRNVLSIARLGFQARRRAARTGVLTLRVGAPRAGRLAVIARGRVAKRRLVVGRASTRVARAGTTRVDLRLSATARRALADGRRLLVSIEARQQGARPRAITVRLTRGER